MENSTASAPNTKIKYEVDEAQHFARVVSSFKNYRSSVEEKIKKRLNDIRSLPPSQQQLLSSYTQSLRNAEDCAQQNQTIIDLIIKDAHKIFTNTNPINVTVSACEEHTSDMELERVQVTIKQLVREWSDYGAVERDACFAPILQELKRYFPANERNPGEVKVLVPGSGLGRLPYEIASAGYTCQGNEFSLFMLIASHFVLNRSTAKDLHCIYPWICQFDNNMMPESRLMSIHFPDTVPNVLNRKPPSRLTMAAGDFLEIYKTSDEWDCVTTCFFIDCARNIVDVIEHIFKILKPGGLWINLGPLTYHYSNVPYEFSIEPEYSCLQEIISGVGFVKEKERYDLKTSYCQNRNSMSQHEYRCLFFSYLKPTA